MGAGILNAAPSASAMIPTLSAPSALKASAVHLAKWIGVGMIGGTVAVGAVGYVGSAMKRSAPQVSNELQSPGPAASAHRRSSNAPVSAALSDNAALSPPRVDAEGTPGAARSAVNRDLGRESGLAHEESGATGPTRPSSARYADENAPLTSPVPSASSLRAVGGTVPKEADPIAPQLAALGGVRQALAARDSTRALALLDAFDARHPASSLREEATVLRIDALSDDGRTSDAHALAIQFLQAFPASAYGEHVRSKSKSR